MCPISALAIQHPGLPGGGFLLPILVNAHNTADACVISQTNVNVTDSDLFTINNVVDCKTRIPHFGGEIIATGEDFQAIGTDRHRHHSIGVPREGANQLAGLRVPELGRVIMATGKDLRAIGIERRRIDTVGMADKGAYFLSGLRVP